MSGYRPWLKCRVAGGKPPLCGSCAGGLSLRGAAAFQETGDTIVVCGSTASPRRSASACSAPPIGVPRGHEVLAFMTLPRYGTIGFGKVRPGLSDRSGRAIARPSWQPRSPSRSAPRRLPRPGCCSARGLRADRRDKLLKLHDTRGQNCTPNNSHADHMPAPRGCRSLRHSQFRLFLGDSSRRSFLGNE